MGYQQFSIGEEKLVAPFIAIPIEKNRRQEKGKKLN
jgi:hypothetical protein